MYTSRHPPPPSWCARPNNVPTNFFKTNTRSASYLLTMSSFRQRTFAIHKVNTLSYSYKVGRPKYALGCVMSKPAHVAYHKATKTSRTFAHSILWTTQTNIHI